MSPRALAARNAYPRQKPSVSGQWRQTQPLAPAAPDEGLRGAWALSSRDRVREIPPLPELSPTAPTPLWSRGSAHDGRSHVSEPHCVTTDDRATIAHSSAERASVRNPASANADERAQRAGIAVGLIALVLEGTFAILSLAAVAFITSAFLASQAAVSVAAFLLQRLGRSIQCQVR